MDSAEPKEFPACFTLISAFSPNSLTSTFRDQIARGYLQGDEPVVVINASPKGRLAFALPGIAPPVCRIALRGSPPQELRTNLDTLILNTDDDLLFLLWRTCFMLKTGPQDIVSVELHSDSIPEQGQKG
jgi:hypothetical protein